MKNKVSYKDKVKKAVELIKQDDKTHRSKKDLKWYLLGILEN